MAFPSASVITASCLIYSIFKIEMTLILAAIIRQNLHKLSSTGYHESGHRICQYSGISPGIIPGIIPPSKIEHTKDFLQYLFHPK